MTFLEANTRLENIYHITPNFNIALHKTKTVRKHVHSPLSVSSSAEDNLFLDSATSFLCCKKSIQSYF